MTFPYHQIAQLHAEGIREGFLSSLGLGFIALLKEAIDNDPGSVLLVREVDGATAGFVADTLDVSRVYRRLKRQPHRLLPVLLPSLAKPSTWRKALEIRRQTSGGGDAETVDLPDRAELLSIAVHPRQRGTGIAADLYHDLVAWFQEQRVPGFRIIVGQDPPNAPPTMTPAHRFYQKMGAQPLQTLQVHEGKESVVYFHKIEEGEREAGKTTAEGR